MAKLKQHALASFSELVQVMLDTNFIYVNRRLVPDEIHEPNYMPPLLKERFHDLLYGGLLFECEPDNSVSGPFFIYEIGLACDTYMSVLCLPEHEGFILIGPYLPDTTQSDTLEALLTDAGIPLSQKNIYSTYLNTLPVLDQSKLYVVFSAFVSSEYQKEVERDFHGFNISPEHPAPCPVFEEDTLQLRAEMLEKRYAEEHRLLNMVIKGDLDAVYNMGSKSFSLDRVPNKLRNEKNLMIILNTLFRKSLETAHVHPLYIDAISGKWAVRIENIDRISQVDALRRDMIRDYCREVQHHSLANYTPNVRAMINFVNFNLNDPELSLKKISEHLGVNASYLSQHFNKEVGRSLPEYITDKRISQAKQLLSSDTNLSVNQIASATGFTDVNYFTKVFKRYTGYTPTSFRKQ
ncbi:helix-turn-helix transcriptional regulator [uncultured Ruthenibacterium sp.]|uniref:helix-turn-helix transcriptional regulator n=1 Tax=uncultured Ruthenibacterium sp. TaxID=1905347 RepID=UPI00349F0521